MKIGAVYPQTEAGTDPGAIREYVQAIESMGFDHIVAFDHVLGANAASRSKWTGAYRHTDSFHEPFVLFGFLAALTEYIEVVSGIIILPQRQTALVAKQAATVDILSGGRLRLGIGIGWNKVEYEALGEDFSVRGIKSEEQVKVLKKLWGNELVTFKGRWHTIIDAGLNPLPIQRSIPLWFGGHDSRVLTRIARFGDGWFPTGMPDNTNRNRIRELHGYASKEGRDPKEIGIESWISIANRSSKEWISDISAWRDLGATHLSINTMNASLNFPDDHVKAARAFKDAIECL